MPRHIASVTCSLAALMIASGASAATLYVSPTGTEQTCCTRAEPCSIGTGATIAAAGDTVILMDGVYTKSLYVRNSGTPEAWITFQADECATPIIQGPGNGPDADVQDTGVGSEQAEYVKFVGIVSRGWNIGFGNGWAGGVESTEVSNGHWEIRNCISASNGRTGFTFFSAEGFSLYQSIAAHNGSSKLHAWSSGVTLFELTGSNNRIEGNISFENADEQKNTDGNGFIVDEASNGVIFVNNLAFRNGGSCLRMTDSSGTKFINNTCYHNAQNPKSQGPTDPSEIYFTNGTNGPTQRDVMFMNNVLVATGVGPGAKAVVAQPAMGWVNNVVTTGEVTFFTSANGDPPDFTPAAGATELLGTGQAGADVPMTDVGFDPKCIVKRPPTLVGSVARMEWYQHDIDLEYVKSIGGVAKCFNAATRSGAPDIGAYKAGAIATVEAGKCVPPPIPDPPTVACATTVGGAGGSGGSDVGGAGPGGSVGAGGTNAGGGVTAMGGTPSAGGAPNAGGAPGAGAAPSAGTTSNPNPGGSGALPPVGGGTSSGTGGSANAAGGPTAPGGGADPGPVAQNSTAASEEGCGCRVAPRPRALQSSGGLALLGAGALLWRRRRRAR